MEGRKIGEKSKGESQHENADPRKRLRRSWFSSKKEAEVRQPPNIIKLKRGREYESLTKEEDEASSAVSPIRIRRNEEGTLEVIKKKVKEETAETAEGCLCDGVDEEEKVLPNVTVPEQQPPTPLKLMGAALTKMAEGYTAGLPKPVSLPTVLCLGPVNLEKAREGGMVQGTGRVEVGKSDAEKEYFKITFKIQKDSEKKGAQDIHPSMKKIIDKLQSFLTKRDGADPTPLQTVSAPEQRSPTPPQTEPASEQRCATPLQTVPPPEQQPPTPLQTVPAPEQRLPSPQTVSAPIPLSVSQPVINNSNLRLALTLSLETILMVFARMGGSGETRLYVVIKDYPYVEGGGRNSDRGVRMSGRNWNNLWSNVPTCNTVLKQAMSGEEVRYSFGLDDGIFIAISDSSMLYPIDVREYVKNNKGKRVATPFGRKLSGKEWRTLTWYGDVVTNMLSRLQEEIVQGIDATLV